MVVRDGVPMAYRYVFSNIHIDPMIGTWHSIHVSKGAKNDTKLMRQIWEVQPNRFLGKLNIDMSHEDDGTVLHQGRSTSGEGPFCFESKSSYGELQFHRIKKVFAKQELTFGIWLGVNFRGAIMASPRVLTRDKLTDDEAKELFDEHFGDDDNFPMVWVSDT